MTINDTIHITNKASWVDTVCDMPYQQNDEIL